MKMHPPHGTPALRASLQAAQADAERLHGAGPMPVWRGPSRRIAWPMAAAAVALLAVGAWSLLRSDEPAMPVVQVAARAASPSHLQLQAPTIVPPHVAPAPVAAAPVVAPPPAVHAIGDEPPAPEPDADAWALNPDSALPVAGHGPLALGNTPELPDENDAMPAEEPPADDELAGAAPP